MMVATEGPLHDAIRKLHGHNKLIVTTDVQDGQIVWSAELYGDDFLDGPWVKRTSGISKNVQTVLRRLARNGFGGVKRERVEKERDD